MSTPASVPRDPLARRRLGYLMAALLVLWPMLEIAEANLAYANSNVNQRMQLVYTGEVTYTESGDAGTDLTYEFGDYFAFCQYGIADEPGRWDNFASALAVRVSERAATPRSAGGSAGAAPAMAMTSFVVMPWPGRLP